jgi:hypothetical protein
LSCLIGDCVNAIPKLDPRLFYGSFVGVPRYPKHLSVLEDAARKWDRNNQPIPRANSEAGPAGKGNGE